MTGHRPPPAPVPPSWPPAAHPSRPARGLFPRTLELPLDQRPEARRGSRRPASSAPPPAPPMSAGHQATPMPRPAARPGAPMAWPDAHQAAPMSWPDAHQAAPMSRPTAPPWVAAHPAPPHSTAHPAPGAPPWGAQPAAPPAAGWPSPPPNRPRRRLPVLAILVVFVVVFGAAAWAGFVPGVSLRGSSTLAPAATAAAGSQAEFCGLAQQQLDDVNSASSGGQADLAGLLERARTRSGQMVAAAPADLKDDVQALQRAGTPLLDALARGEQPTQDQLDQVQRPTVLLAGARVANYVQSSCGINLPAGLPLNS